MNTNLTIEQSHDMTEAELNAAVFAGASMSEHRGLRETLGDDVIAFLPNHPAWDDFSDPFQDWVFNAVDALVEEDFGSDPMGDWHGRNE